MEIIPSFWHVAHPDRRARVTRGPMVHSYAMDLIALLALWGVPLVFAAVLLEQSGLPLPAAPILVSAGALAADGAMRPEEVLVAALVAALLADHAWFVTGRRYGRRLLANICRLSLSPDTCVRKTDDLIARHGPYVLLVAKFIPGVSAVAIPTAAAMGISYRRFLAFDSVGCLLWAGTYVGAGVIFSREITGLLLAMSWIGGSAVAVVVALFALYIGWKLLHRWRLKRLHRLVRISPHEILPLLEEDPGVVIVDARSALARAEDPRVLPRSIVLDDRNVIDVFPHAEKDRVIVTFCTCPNEASAALLAEQLIKAGFGRVRVLTGGADAIALLSVPSSG
jgi:membrane protein DedA with SNARE-associated domain/rhodanese-related sulfurtransferase